MPTVLGRGIDLFKALLLEIQEYTLLVARSLTSLVHPTGDWRDYTDQMDGIGAASVPIVLLTGFFVGAILVTQAGPELKDYGAESLLGRITGLSIVRGISPVITAMMVASRVCSGTAAEIGMMRVNQQIEALETMGADPVAKLVTPRIIAATLMFPMLTVLNITAAVITGGFLAGQGSAKRFILESLRSLESGDILLGITKSMIFGFCVVSVAAYYGFTAEGGANGVRANTTRAVILSLMLILTLDFIITAVVHTF